MLELAPSKGKMIPKRLKRVSVFNPCFTQSNAQIGGVDLYKSELLINFKPGSKKGFSPEAEALN
jgi:hypothetical protein